jgi:Domain of unknown function (DUF309)
MEFDWTQGALAEGLRLYHAGEFFAAHEAWEGVWLRAQEPEKKFLQGLIQVTAAFHHLQRITLLVSETSPLPCSAVTFANGYKRSKRVHRRPNLAPSESTINRGIARP